MIRHITGHKMTPEAKVRDKVGHTDHSVKLVVHFTINKIEMYISPDRK